MLKLLHNVNLKAVVLRTCLRVCAWARLQLEPPLCFQVGPLVNFRALLLACWRGRSSRLLVISDCGHAGSSLARLVACDLLSSRCLHGRL